MRIPPGRHDRSNGEHVPRAELPSRIEEGDVVGAREVLRHVDDGRMERRFAVVVGRLLGHVAGKLRHLHFAVQFPLEARIQDLRVVKGLSAMSSRPKREKPTATNQSLGVCLLRTLR